ncbi:MAG: hypothetical protein ABW106_05465 [Steroidobacteraceae bacterium]
MDTVLKERSSLSTQRDYQLAVMAVKSLPDHCAMDVTELAERIGADKLDLIRWVRADITFARLIASKVAT